MDSDATDNRFDDLERTIRYRFRNRNLLLEALTHRSFLNEVRRRDVRDNERLEFLGDAVLSFCVSSILFERFPEDREGHLTKARASLVDEKSLAHSARNVGLASYLHMGKGEERSGGREKPSILANAFEALLGAIYLDGGIEPVKRLIWQQFEPLLGDLVSRVAGRDPKTTFQEMAQAVLGNTPTYCVKSTEGPDHARTFRVIALIGEEVFGEGEGENKKEAEQKAAAEGLKRLHALPAENRKIPE